MQQILHLVWASRWRKPFFVTFPLKKSYFFFTGVKIVGFYVSLPENIENIMKKILFSLVLGMVLFSCQNNEENKMLREMLMVQKKQITDLENENAELRAKLNMDEVASSNEDIQHVGRWLDNRPGANTQLQLDKDLKTGNHYLTFKFDDGSSSRERVQITKERGLMRFQEINSEHVEWYVIEKNGDLSLWSQNGKYGTALCF